MTRTHAFGDDALGDLDAVGLVDALRAGRVSIPDLVDAAIARTEAVNPTLNGLAYEAFDRARARARAPRRYGGYFDGVPTFIKDNVAVEGMPTMQGTDAWDPTADAGRRRVRPRVPVHRTGAARQDADVGVRLQRVGGASADRPGPQPVESRLHGGRVVVRVGRVRRRRGRADRARQRRRRVDSDSGGVQRAGRPEAVAGPVCRWTKRLRQMPLHLVANGVGDPLGARHRGVLRGKPSGSSATPSCLRSATSPTRASSGCVSRSAPNRFCARASPEVRELTLKTAALLEELGHRVTEIENPVPQQIQGRLPAVLVVPGVRRWCAAGAASFGAELRPHQAGQPDAGPGPLRGRNLHRLPHGDRAAVPASRRITARLPAPTMRC